jgi:hypothetical protein
MTPKAFINFLDTGFIPPEPLKCHSFYNYEYRNEATSRGMWAVIDEIWTKDLALWLGKRKCLEIMAGHGWLSKALNDYGVNIKSTDDQSWVGCRHSKGKPFSIVENLDGMSAVKKYSDAEVLIVSWPPYEDPEIEYICEEWGSDRPIIYIGEGWGGCTATDEFHENFKEDESVPDFDMKSWSGINDRVKVGYYKKGEE